MAKVSYKTSKFLKQSQVPANLRQNNKAKKIKRVRSRTMGTDVRTITKITRYNQKTKPKEQKSKKSNVQESDQDWSNNLPITNGLKQMNLDKNVQRSSAAMESTRKKNQQPNFKRYIHRLRKKKLDNKYTASHATIETVNNFVMDMFEKLSNEASVLVKKAKRRTILSGDIRAAVRMLLPDGLACEAMSYASKSMAQYNNSL